MAVAIVAVSALVTESASAAMTVGQTFTPTAKCQEGANSYVQSGVADGNSYAVPAKGVITSWSFQAGATVPTELKLKVFRAIEPGKLETSWVVTGESSPAGLITALAANVRPTRVAVDKGDVLGIYATGGACSASPSGGLNYYQFWGGDLAVGSTNTAAFPFSGQRIPVSASVEPDADHDGYGDETQDRCPTDPSTLGGCPDHSPPQTTIVKSPPKRTTNKKATFKLASSEPGSRFECKLDGRFSFARCSGSEKLRVGLGRHKLAVRAVDAAGNVDPTPATFGWRVVKKKHRRHPHHG